MSGHYCPTCGANEGGCVTPDGRFTPDHDLRVVCRAVTLMRDSAHEMAAPMTLRDSEFLGATAEMLDRVARDWDIAQYGYWSACALAVASAYLGEGA